MGNSLYGSPGSKHFEMFTIYSQHKMVYYSALVMVQTVYLIYMFLFNTLNILFCFHLWDHAAWHTFL